VDGRREAAPQAVLLRGHPTMKIKFWLPALVSRATLFYRACTTPFTDPFSHCAMPS
jgi:hypothetical protein